MADLSFGASANVFIDAGQVVRVSTSGVATVQMQYGGPSGTDTITANTRDYGPYGVPAKIRITATSGTVNYREMDEDPGFSQSEASALRGLASGDGMRVVVGGSLADTILIGNNTTLWLPPGATLTSAGTVQHTLIRTGNAEFTSDATAIPGVTIYCADEDRKSVV